MPPQSAAVNTDTNTKSTTAYYADRGDGTSAWHHVSKIYDGGDVAQGATDDTAVTNPASSGSVIALLKGMLTKLTAGATTILKLEDAAHASGDAGVMALAVRRDTAAASSGTSGDYEPLQTDATGLLRTRTTPVTATISQTTALAASKVVKASAGVLRGFAGYSTTAQFIQVHDASSLPADTTVPELVFPIEANKPFSFSIPEGHACGTGIVICNSTTGPTKTIGTTDTWITAYYE